MKKFIVIASLLLSLSFTSCKQQTVESVLDRVQSCETIDELTELSMDEDLNSFVESLPQEEQEKIYNAVSEKAFSIVVNQGLDEE
ncbi:MAG: hypothetical protein HDS58_04440 [Barnesiella sp.]|nr:hypothetical protein [Barnesiella sp.]